MPKSQWTISPYFGQTVQCFENGYTHKGRTGGHDMAHNAFLFATMRKRLKTELKLTVLRFLAKQSIKFFWRNLKTFNFFKVFLNVTLFICFIYVYCIVAEELFEGYFLWGAIMNRSRQSATKSSRKVIDREITEQGTKNYLPPPPPGLSEASEIKVQTEMQCYRFIAIVDFSNKFEYFISWL